jgi:hypothetical protein
MLNYLTAFKRDNPDAKLYAPGLPDLRYNRTLNLWQASWCPMCNEGNGEAVSKFDRLYQHCYACGYDNTPYELWSALRKLKHHYGRFIIAIKWHCWYRWEA